MDANSIRAAGDDPVARPTWMLVALRALRPETTRRQGRDETDSQDSERAEHPGDARDAPLTLACRRHGADGLSSCCDEPHSSLIGGRRAYLELSRCTDQARAVTVNERPLSQSRPAPQCGGGRVRDATPFLSASSRSATMASAWPARASPRSRRAWNASRMRPSSLETCPRASSPFMSPGVYMPSPSSACRRRRSARRYASTGSSMELMSESLAAASQGLG